jgi:hypothetical protein
MNDTTDKRMQDIKANLSDDKLLQLAFSDAVAEFARFALDKRSAKESTNLLGNWKNTFEKLHRSNLVAEKMRRQ